MVGLDWVHRHTTSTSYLSTMWAPNLPCGTRHCPALPRCSLPPYSRLRNSLACLLLLPSRTGGLLRVAPNHARSFGDRRGVTRVTSQGSRRDSSSMGFTQGQVFRLPSMTVETVPSVAVIGAGAAGLAAGRILREEGLTVTIFEKSRHVGGVWRYKPRDELAPMYRSLVTNLPKETMSYLGFPFPAEMQSFTTHDQVLGYLESFADAHDLHPLIKFGCTVESVRPLEGGQGLPSRDGLAGEGEAQEEKTGALGKWEIVHRSCANSNNHDTECLGEQGGSGTTQKAPRNGQRGATTPEAPDGKRKVSGGVAVNGAGHASGANTAVTEVFDAVCVCNGHYDDAFTPKTPGFDGFRGISMHARAYDQPEVEAFIGRRVLCVGSRSSGTDIAREVSSVASVVHVCDRAATVSTAGGGERGNVWWRPALDKFEGGSGVRFTDGTLAEVDTVVWCTGYNYSFPFLEGSGLLTPPVTQRVHPLYEQLFHVQHPSLSFVGLPQSVVPFPLFELQANAVAAAITGRMSLPSRVEREQWLLEEEKRGQQERGVNPGSRAVHVLGGRQWDYGHRLLEMAGGPGVAARAPVEQPKSGDAGLGPEVDAAGASSIAAAEEEREEVLRTLKIKQVLNDDASKSRPRFPGGPDDYRRRMYEVVDREAGTFSVSLAERKANGEGPSPTATSAVKVASSDGS